VLLQTRQEQATTGTPVDVPEPRTVTSKRVEFDMKKNRFIKYYDYNEKTLAL
jgi:hypothetical protein